MRVSIERCHGGMLAVDGGHILAIDTVPSARGSEQLRPHARTDFQHNPRFTEAIRDSPDRFPALTCAYIRLIERIYAYLRKAVPWRRILHLSPRSAPAWRCVRLPGTSRRSTIST